MTPGARIGIVAAVIGALVAVVIVKERAQGREAEPAVSQAPVGAVMEPRAAVGEPGEAAAVPGGAAGGMAAASERPLPRLVDLGSTTCVPCKLMAPILDELQSDFSGRMVVDVIDVGREREAAQRYGIRVIPTQIFYGADGRELFRHEGFLSKEAILAKWKELGFDMDAVRAEG